MPVPFIIVRVNFNCDLFKKQEIILLFLKPGTLSKFELTECPKIKFWYKRLTSNNKFAPLDNLFLEIIKSSTISLCIGFIAPINFHISVTGESTFLWWILIYSRKWSTFNKSSDQYNFEGNLGQLREQMKATCRKQRKWAEEIRKRLLYSGMESQN